MIQLIITIIIALAAFAYALYLLYKKFFKKPDQVPDDCKSCSSDCKSCPMANEVMLKK